MPLAGPDPPEPPGKMHPSGIPMCFTAQPLSLYREVLNLGRVCPGGRGAIKVLESPVLHVFTNYKLLFVWEPLSYF